MIIRDLDELVVIHEDAWSFLREARAKETKYYYYRNNSPRILKEELFDESIDRVSGFPGFLIIAYYLNTLKSQLGEFRGFGFSAPWDS
jgi:hypothetical protein